MARVTATELRPMPQWGAVARTTFWSCWSAALVFRAVCDLTAVDDDGTWRVVHVTVAMIGVAGGVIWGVAVYRRRH